jgi:hypothetical protein
VLRAVVAISRQDAIAIGQRRGPTLAEQWNGRTWSSIQHSGSLQTRNSGNWPSLRLSASASDDIWSNHLDHWNGTSWTYARTPTLGPFGIGPWDVTAVSRTDAWAVGDDILARWNGRSWHSVPSPVRYFELWQVSVISPGDVWTAGYTYDQTEKWTSARPLIERWNGQHWTINAIDNLKHRWGITQIVAVSPNDVWVVGQPARYTPGSVLDHWDGRRWTATPQAPDETIIDLERAGPDIWALLDDRTGRGVLQELTPCS